MEKALHEESPALTKALQFRIRSQNEEKLRGAMFYAWSKRHHQEENEYEFQEMEEFARNIHLEAPGMKQLCKDIQSFCPKTQEQWVDLERMFFMASRVAKWQKDKIGIEMQCEEDAQFSLDTLKLMANQCQSDKVQKVAREAFLMSNVCWYDYERIGATSPFGALCTVANESLNGLVEKGSAECHVAIEKCHEEHKEFFPCAAMHVFFEYVRCQNKRVYVVYSLKDHKDPSRKPGDVLWDAQHWYILTKAFRLLGPLQCPIETIDLWIKQGFVKFRLPQPL